MRTGTLCTIFCAWALGATGCGEPVSGGQKPTGPIAAVKPAPQPTATPKTVRKKLGPNVFLEFEGQGAKRRVLVEAEVCLRQGFLEHLLSRDQAEKFHESILSAEFDAQHIHVGLLAAGAVPGWPVKFPIPRFPEEREMAPALHALAFTGSHQGLGPLAGPVATFTAGLDDAFIPQYGDKIRVTLEYPQGGKRVRVAGQRWIRDFKTRKELSSDWIFTGSKLYFDPEDPTVPPYYGANEGRVICVTNFSNALLDLSVKSEEGDPREGLQWEAHTELIPPVGTKVTVILEPLPKK